MKEVRPPKRPLIFYYCVAMLILLLFNFLAMPWMARQQIQEVDYGTFMDMAENQDLGQVEIQEQENQIVFTNKDETAVYSTGMIPDPDLKQMLKDSGAEFSGQVIQQTDPILSFLLTWILPIVIFVALGQYLSRRMMKNMGGPNAMTFGKSNAKVYVKSSEGIKFSDVAGEDEAKDNLKEIVEYLHDPKKYQEIGATMPKGILLVGPPGTGKTMLAKAVAGEANVPFFSISGSDFVEMFVGMGASKVRDLFKQAKEKAPCIVFIDEIDAIGQKRNSGAYGGNDEREQTLNQLLTEMDGFEGNTGVIILAATNRPESLDPALTRPGRFDRRVPVELPDLKGREDILKVHAKKIKVAEDVDFGQGGPDGLRRQRRGAGQHRQRGGPAGGAGRPALCHPGGSGGEHRGGHRRLPEEERHPHRPGEEGGGLPRDRPRPGGGQADPFRPGAEDHHHAPHLRRPGLHHAGGGGQPLPDEPGGAGEQDRHPHRRPGRRGAGLPLRLHRRLQRHRAGHQAGPGHDHPVRHERGLRHGGPGDGAEPVPGRATPPWPAPRRPRRRSTGRWWSW